MDGPHRQTMEISTRVAQLALRLLSDTTILGQLVDPKTGTGPVAPTAWHRWLMMSWGITILNMFGMIRIYDYGNGKSYWTSQCDIKAGTGFEDCSIASVTSGSADGIFSGILSGPLEVSPKRNWRSSFASSCRRLRHQKRSTRYWQCKPQVAAFPWSSRSELTFQMQKIDSNGLSINGGTQNGWFIMDNPTIINEWFRGTPILENLQMNCLQYWSPCFARKTCQSTSSKPWGKCHKGTRIWRKRWPMAVPRHWYRATDELCGNTSVDWFQ